MNICFLNSIYPDPCKGGVERVTHDLISFLKQRGHQVFCFCLLGELPPVQEQICLCAGLPEPDGWTCPENREAFGKFLRENRIDVLHIQSERTLALELCEQTSPLNCRIVAANHSSPVTRCETLDDRFRPLLCCGNLFRSLRDGLKEFLKLLLCGKNSRRWEYVKQPRLYRLCDAYAVLSESFVPEFERYVKTGNENKFRVIPNPAVCDDAAVPSVGSKRLLWVGRMVFSPKRPDRMIRIWEKLYRQFPDWELCMVGDGDAKEVLEKYCTRKKIPRVVFTGRRDPQELYRSSRIFCMTSSREGWGLVLTEAMNGGCVPVAYNSYSSLADIIQDGENGCAVPAFNTAEYCERLRHLMTDESERARMAEQAKESVRRFSLEKIGRQWEELYRELCER